ncbi:HAD family hydrolase [Gilvibacter sp.]|uniref:HAD family hydrolase n=1 Tax=Gilvibacter sp. TaxID=2729997 RepID=UPI0035BE6C57
MNNKKLCLLDLDHTLIYGSYAPTERVELLLEYSEYLKVYKRPFVNDFVSFLNKHYRTIIVYTTAKEDYANRICLELEIKAVSILTRNDCLSQNDHYYKTFQPEWAKTYQSIHIIDDSPNVWLETEPYKNQIELFIPKEFRGEINDTELLDITKRLQLKEVLL